MVRGGSPEGRGSRLAACAAVAVVASLALVWTLGTFAAPWLESTAMRGAGFVRLAYAPLCHQAPERSLDLPRGEQAVCARCAGLYLGGVVGLLAGLWLAGVGARAPRPWLLAAGLAPTVTDAVLPWIALPAAPNWPRMLIALPGGVVCGLFLAAGVAEIVLDVRRSRPLRGAQPMEESHG